MAITPRFLYAILVAGLESVQDSDSHFCRCPGGAVVPLARAGARFEKGKFPNVGRTVAGDLIGLAARTA